MSHSCHSKGLPFSHIMLWSWIKRIPDQELPVFICCVQQSYKMLTFWQGLCSFSCSKQQRTGIIVAAVPMSITITAPTLAAPHASTTPCSSVCSMI